MRRMAAALTALTLTLVFTGCGLASWLQPVEDLPSVGIGSCLDGMNGADSDRTAVVDCDEPHLFEVTSIDQWPGMTDAIAAAGGDLGAVWDDIHLAGGDASSAEYGAWASRNCNEAAQRTVGISDVEVDGHTAADLWLRAGGSYGVDLSLASRDRFVVENDLSTFCSMAWYDEAGKPRLLDSPAFESLLRPGFDAGLRECWAGDDAAISCEEPHAAQVLLSFDGLEAFGPELVGRAAAGQPTDADGTVTDAFCEQLMVATMPSTLDLGGLRIGAETAASYAWDEFEGTINPEGLYSYACVAVGAAGETFTGDVFDGSAVTGSPA